MRVAFVGKGGVGKSAIAGTFARLLARRCEPVLAIDSDPMPGLAFSMGLAPADTPIPDEVVEEKAQTDPGPRYRLRPGLTAADAVERYAAVAPDGVRFLQFGKSRGHVVSLVRSQFAFRQILDELPDEGWNLVGDLPGGTRQPFFGWGRYAREVVIVVEPTAKSMLSARRLGRLAQTEGAPGRVVAVLNKARQPDDLELVQRRTGLDVVGAVPWDAQLADAERRGVAPVDHAPDSAAAQAIGALVEYFGPADRGRIVSTAGSHR